MESTLTTIELNFEQLLLATSIIASVEFKLHRAGKLHSALKEKLERAKYACFPRKTGRVACTFTEQEKLLMRQYNTDWCEILSGNWQEMEKDPELAGPHLAVMTQGYLVANQLQRRFTSLY